MPDRGYTTKARAKRIALDYLARPDGLRRWQSVLSVGLPILALVWLALSAARGDHRVYTSGPVATAHLMFGMQCGDCHVAAAGAASGAASTGFFLPVSDRTCTVCHEGPIHHANQPQTPACASCHFEHKGRSRLGRLANRECLQCHAHLVTKDGHPPAFAPSIAGFAAGHPEFAVNVMRDGRPARVRLDDTSAPRDAAQIKLNHAVHLKPALQGIDDVQVRTGRLGIVERAGKPALGCSYCHRLDAQRVSMQPIAFARHCIVCHPLDVDETFPGAVAPHDTPTLVHAYLRTTLIEAFEQCSPTAPGDASAKLARQCRDLGLATATSAPDADGDTPRRRLPGRAPDQPRGLRARGDTDPTTAAPPAAPASALDWAATRLDGIQKVMFRQKCEFCHVLDRSGGNLPAVVPTAIPARWLPHSVFGHGTHRSLMCTECHGRATKSTETADVLLPSVSVCRECHRAAGGARTSCVECHRYHDMTNDRDPDGPFTIPRLVHGAAARAGGGAR